MRSTPHLCSAPGCAAIIEGAGRCPEHQYARRSRTGNRDPAYGTRRWRTTRNAYASTHPVCEVPSCSQPVGIVHHLDGLGPAGPRGHDPANLRSACHHHHRQVTHHAELNREWWPDAA